jgi:signal transduction histidine kinase
MHAIGEGHWGVVRVILALAVAVPVLGAAYVVLGGAARAQSEDAVLRASGLAVLAVAACRLAALGTAMMTQRQRTDEGLSLRVLETSAVLYLCSVPGALCDVLWPTEPLQDPLQVPVRPVRMLGYVGASAAIATLRLSVLADGGSVDEARAPLPPLRWFSYVSFAADTASALALVHFPLSPLWFLLARVAVRVAVTVLDRWLGAMGDATRREAAARAASKSTADDVLAATLQISPRESSGAALNDAERRLLMRWSVLTGVASALVMLGPDAWSIFLQLSLRPSALQMSAASSVSAAQGAERAWLVLAGEVAHVVLAGMFGVFEAVFAPAALSVSHARAEHAVYRAQLSAMQRVAQRRTGLLRFLSHETRVPLVACAAAADELISAADGFGGTAERRVGVAEGAVAFAEPRSVDVAEGAVAFAEPKTRTASKLLSSAERKTGTASKLLSSAERKTGIERTSTTTHTTTPPSDPPSSLSERLSARQRELVGGIRAGVEAARAVLDDLLALESASEGKLVLQPRPVELVAEVASCLRIFTSSVLSKRLRLSLEPTLGEQVWVRADSHRLAQIVRNFISNAIKHSPDGGTVVVRVEPGSDPRVAQALREGFLAVRVSVVDEGEGVDAANVRNLFLPFQQFLSSSADPSSAVASGTGLGLTISRSIAEQMGGVVGYLAPNSGEGRGSGKGAFLDQATPASSATAASSAPPAAFSATPASSAPPAASSPASSASPRGAVFFVEIPLEQAPPSGRATPSPTGTPLSQLQASAAIGDSDSDSSNATPQLLRPRRPRRPRQMEPVVGERGAAAVPALGDRDATLLGKVCVVEDDEFFRRRVCQGLRNLGWGVLEVENVRAAVERIRARAAELRIVVTDDNFGLPDFSGKHLCRILRADSALRHIRIVGMTGDDSAEALDEFRAAGLDDVLVKGDLRALHQRLLELL